MLVVNFFFDKHCRFLAAIIAGQPPKPFKKVTKHEVWREAMRAELKALEDQGTCELQPLPAGKNALGSYTEKYDEQGKL